jgi:SAM-dependent methyltransferase
VRREEIGACPACACPSRRPAYAALTDEFFGTAPGEWQSWSCDGCGSLYLDPRPTRETIGAAYAGPYYTHDASQAPHAAALERWGRLRNGYLNQRFGYREQPASGAGPIVVRLLPHRRAIIDRSHRHLDLRAGRRLLDVGCGAGAFVAQMSAMGWAAMGIDVDPAAVEAAEAAGRPVRLAELRDLAAETPRPEFDAITLNHVIEHLYEPHEQLVLALSLLRPGGRIWLATPNARALAHRYFRSHWTGLDAPRHLFVLSRRALQTMLIDAGFEATSFATPAPALSTHLSWMSLAAARGENPLEIGTRPVRRRDRIAVTAIEWLPLLAPTLNDELVVLARRPSINRQGRAVSRS